MAERTTASVLMRTVASLNPSHGQHYSLGRQLFRRRDRHPPTRHGRNLRVPNKKCCQIGIQTSPLGLISDIVPNSKKKNLKIFENLGKKI